MRHFILLTFLIFGIIACTPYDKKKLEAPIQKQEESAKVLDDGGDKTPPKNGFIFFSIDNKVVVYVNDSLAYESDLIFENPKLNIPVELTSFLRKGNNKVTVKLWNEGCDGCHHNYWYIRYELLEDGETIDYFYDDAKRVFQDEGWKFERTYDLYYE